MFWIAAKLGVDRRLIVLAACDCARLALPYVPVSEERPRLAIETAEAWTLGEATLEEARTARDAAAAYADAAASAGHAAASAGHAAASAGYAAASAGYAAASAASAGHAADAASYAAYDASYAVSASASSASSALQRARMECCSLIRVRIPEVCE
jgi:hypothetical protein